MKSEVFSRSCNFVLGEKATLMNCLARTHMNLKTQQLNSMWERRQARKSHAFSILELMLVLAISSILATVAVVLYRDYLETARLGVLDAGISSIAPFQEAHKLKSGRYAEGSWQLEGEDDQSLFDAIGWRPSSQETDLTIEVTLIEGGFQVTADNAYGESLCREFPSRKLCDT